MAERSGGATTIGWLRALASAVVILVAGAVLFVFAPELAAHASDGAVAEWARRRGRNGVRRRVRRVRVGVEATAGTARDLMPGEPRVPDAEWLWENEPCRAACPVHTDAGGYVTAIAEGRYRDAYLIARAPNPFASICGRVCAAPCETACRRGTVDAPISIRALKRFVTERFGVESFAANAIWHEAHGPVPPATGPSVGVIGGGPAGLAARTIFASPVIRSPCTRPTSGSAG